MVGHVFYWNTSFPTADDDAFNMDEEELHCKPTKALAGLSIFKSMKMIHASKILGGQFTPCMVDTKVFTRPKTRTTTHCLCYNVSRANVMNQLISLESQHTKSDL